MALCLITKMFENLCCKEFSDSLDTGASKCKIPLFYCDWEKAVSKYICWESRKVDLYLIAIMWYMYV